MPATDRPSSARPAGGADRGPAGVTLLRAVGFIAAIALGVISVWLLVTSDSAKSVRIGALCGFWGLLLGGFSVFGRHLQQPAGTAATVAAAELALRGRGALDRPEDARARLDFEMRLVQMLRREVQDTMSGEIAKLSADVVALRTEIVEKVGGQLRMERIETTRIFGSDIEALQAEINQLKAGTVIDPDEYTSVQIRRIAEVEQVPPAAPRPPRSPEVRLADRPADDGGVRARSVADRAPEPEPEPEPEPAGGELVVAEQGPATAPIPAAKRTLTPPAPPAPPRTAPEPPNAPEPAPAVVAAGPEPAPEPEAIVEPEPVVAAEPGPAEPEPEAAPEPEPVRADHRDLEPAVDVFAGLPRLRVFTDFELDPAPAPAARPGPAEEPEPEAAPASRAARRRAAEAEDAAGGGRRRRESDDDTNNVLAQILARAKQETPS